MPRIHYIRIGVLGQIGRFHSSDDAEYDRGCRVICQTPRGLEVGEVLRTPNVVADASSPDGTVVRPVSREDEQTWERLEQQRGEAYTACVDRLRQESQKAILLDVEPLFDGKALFFYFLGPITPEIETLTAELAEIYAAKVQCHDVSEATNEGCCRACGDGGAGGGGHCDSCCFADRCQGCCASSG